MVRSDSAPGPQGVAVTGGHQPDTPRPEPGSALAFAGPAGDAPSVHRPAGWARLSPLMVWGMLAAAVGYILVANPTDRKPDLLGGCGWYAMFGTNGPTCGGTRMVWYLLHGDLVNAARMHLVALIGTPFVLYMLVQWSALWLFGWRLPALRLRWWVWAAYAVVFMVYGAVLRNLPGFEWFHIDYMQAGIGL
jgi:Protein of unknown function (DUF2752)